MKQFTDRADFAIHFQPFQLYPELPRLDPKGVDKESFFKDLSAQRRPGTDEHARKKGFQHLQGEWKKDGLALSEQHGSMGNSFDAQRLLLLARKQGREDEMIEAVYTANHENNLCLSNLNVLLACAEKAGVQGAQEWLKGEQGFDEVHSRIQAYRAAGVTQVPTLIFNEKFALVGAPDRRTLEVALRGLIEKGDSVAWPPQAPPVGLPEFVSAARGAIAEASDNDRQKWLHHKLDWSDGDPRWALLEGRILKNASVRKTLGDVPFKELQDRMRRELNPKWDVPDDLALRCPAEASSTKSAEKAAPNAVDGNPETRWTSAYRDEQWLSVDLGAVSQVSRVEICWEAAHAKTYSLQGSDDGVSWTTWASEAGREGWVETPLPPGSGARWVRMLGHERATPFGFSLWELRVFGPKEQSG